MDAEQRHELKTNELANFLLKLKEWSDKYLNTVLTIVAVAALAWAGYRFWSWRQENAVHAAWAEVSRANIRDLTAGDAPLDQLRRVIAEAPDPTVAAIARIRLATGLVQRAGEAGGEARLSEAATELRNVVNSGEADSLKGAALFKLATVSEGQRDMKAAREAYETLINNPQYAALPFKTLAEDRIKTLDEIAARVEFLPGAAPLPTPPATASAPASAKATDAALMPIASAPPVPAPVSQPASKPASDAEVEPAPQKTDDKPDQP
jgi:predicted negative regulator of RcsB-dependent stress response